jgi:uncharacterized DUF497 family protein
MKYGWDPEKSAANLRERGFDFLFATLIFDAPRLEKEDTRHDYGERRMITIGIADGITLTVVYTDRLDPEGQVVRRIISARKSNRREREAYEEAVGS